MTEILEHKLKRSNILHRERGRKTDRDRQKHTQTDSERARERGNKFQTGR